MSVPADLPLVIAGLLTEALDLHTQQGHDGAVDELVDLAHRIRVTPDDMVLRASE